MVVVIFGRALKWFNIKVIFYYPSIVSSLTWKTFNMVRNTRIIEFIIPWSFLNFPFLLFLTPIWNFNVHIIRNIAFAIECRFCCRWFVHHENFWLRRYTQQYTNRQTWFLSNTYCCLIPMSVNKALTYILTKKAVKA